MNRRETGFLLLTSHLGDPERKVLTAAQLRTLASRAGLLPRQDREMTAEDLVAIGYDRTMAQRIIKLLCDEEQLRWYLHRGERQNCHPMTRVSSAYPQLLRKRLMPDAPGCLWAKGDTSLLELPAVALVGSRELRQENLEFARRAGSRAAEQGFVLVSGNARGADKAAQEACLARGGKVISVVADSLEEHRLRENVLYLAEDGYDLPFSSLRALSRNRIIHSLGRLTLVAQSTLGKGGTWDGTTKNLRQNLSPVFCFRDGSEAMEELVRMGGTFIDLKDLEDLRGLQTNIINFIDQ